MQVVPSQLVTLRELLLNFVLLRSAWRAWRLEVMIWLAEHQLVAISHERQVKIAPICQRDSSISGAAPCRPNYLRVTSISCSEFPRAVKRRDEYQHSLIQWTTRLQSNFTA